MGVGERNEQIARILKVSESRVAQNPPRTLRILDQGSRLSREKPAHGGAGFLPPAREVPGADFRKDAGGRRPLFQGPPASFLKSAGNT